MLRITEMAYIRTNIVSRQVSLLCFLALLPRREQWKK